jgi:hypothetical protein
VSEHLGRQLKRLPDGEVGERYYWIQFQRARFDATEGLERVGDTPFYIRDQFDGRPFRLADGFAAENLEFPPLGYADAAIESYSTFARLKSDGVIPATVRFQVSLPTPAGVIGSFVVPADRAAIESEYERAVFGELQRIVDEIPHDQLAIQWDTALEFGFLEQAEIRGNRLIPWFGSDHQTILDGVVERAVRQAAAVPPGVEVGYHLCYGDVEEHHFVEPADATMLAEVAAGLFESSPRAIDWLHLPVPIERDDAAYFEPFGRVRWPKTTDIYLGLLHHEDGSAGALRRAAMAAEYVPTFGVATECGFGRGPRERTPSLLDLHAEVAEAL